MARSIWNGMLGFGLVNIPVGMYPATRDNQVAFHLLHKKDCGRVKNQRVCSTCGEILDYDEIVKGFEYEKGAYVAVTPQELQNVKPETTELINICGFIDLEDVDPIFFDVPYYLVPWKKSDKIFVLLREAMKKSDKVALTKFVLRTREYLAVVRPYGDILILNTMHYADEVRAVEDAPAHSLDVADREMEMAVKIIDAMEDEFDATAYKDTYSEALNALVDKKLQGKNIVAKTSHKQATNVIDLFSRLEASLNESGRPKGAGKATSGKAAAGKAEAGKAETSKTPPRKRATAAASGKANDGEHARSKPKAAPAAKSKSTAAGKAKAKGTTKSKPPLKLVA